MRADPRKRMTERLSGTKLKLEVHRSLRPLMIIAVGAAVGIACASYILGHIGGGFGDTRPVRFTVPDATGFVPDRAEVRFRGIPAGNVSTIEIVGDHAVVTANIDRRYGTIYKDARAVARPNTPLQDMYLDVVSRGTKAAGPVDDDPLPLSQTTSSVNVAEVLNVFEPDVRAHLKDLLAQLGTGLEDRGEGLRWSFEKLGGLIAVVGRISEQLEQRQQTTRRLVRDVGTLSQTLAHSERQLRSVVRDGNSVLAATASGSRDLDATLRELPGTLSAAEAGLTTLDGILPRVNNAVRKLDPVAERLPAGLASVRSVSDAAAPAVRALRQPLAKLVPLSAQVRPFARSLSQAVQGLRPQTADVTKVTTDVAGCPAAAFQFFQFTASLTKYEDALGVYPRGDFGFALDSVSGADDPFVTASKSCAPGEPKASAP